jgi:excisionase family DNA binding protein
VNTPAPPLAYTDAEVAASLRVSKRTVYRLRKSGALGSIRIGRSVRTPAASLTEFLERVRNGR